MYEVMLEVVRNRMKEIEQVALEQDSYNEEWLQLTVTENCLIKLIKIEKERK